MRYMQERTGRPLADKAHYVPTDRWLDQPPGGEGVRGRAWIYRPPAER